MGILRTKRDNNKFKEARKWLDEHPEEAAKMDICMTKDELIEELKKKRKCRYKRWNRRVCQGKSKK